MGLTNGNILYQNDLYGIVRIINYNSIQNKELLVSGGYINTDVNKYPFPLNYAETFNTGSGDDNRFYKSITRTQTGFTGSSTGLYDTGSKLWRTNYSGTMTTYDDHNDSSLTTTKWISGVGGNTVGAVTEASDYVSITAGHGTGGPGLTSNAKVFASGTSTQFPIETGLTYLCVIGSFDAGASAASTNAGAALYWGGQAIGSILLTGSAHRGLAATVIECFQLSNGSWLLYHDGVYKRSMTLTSPALLIGSAYANDGGTPSYGTAACKIHFENYATGTYSATTVQSSGLFVAPSSILGIFVSPLYTASGTGTLTVDTSTNGGTSWTAGQAINSYINTSGTTTGSWLALKFNLNSAGSRRNVNEVIMSEFAVSVFV